jgi:citrate synthase
MALDIGSPENAAEYAANLLDNGNRIMGFGHRVYKAEDPRARHLRDRSKVLGESGHSWSPVLDRTTNKVVGMVHLHDLVARGL